MSFFGCAGSKANLPVVQSVDINRYLGTWYEIVRLPNSFEKGLKCVTANYSLKENGDIKVTNAGYSITDPGVRKSSTGTAWVVDPSEPAKLKVRFFWPFAGNYWIISLDSSYRYAMVGDPSRDYLWILARDPILQKETINGLLSQAQALGFDSSKVEFIAQDCKSN